MTCVGRCDSETVSLRPQGLLKAKSTQSLSVIIDFYQKSFINIRKNILVMKL